MPGGWRRFGSYRPVSARLAAGQKQALLLARKAGRPLAPVTVADAATRSAVATTFWGQAWCAHLEHLSDFANRLPRGRTLVRNGSVLDLHIVHGRVTALVAGTTLYQTKVTITPAPAAAWRSLTAELGGRIDSVVELLAGRISDAVMRVLTDPSRGLFPAPAEIAFTCTCPDAAALCKHLAATLYGVGARLDTAPELLFVLRQVDPEALVQVALSAGVRAVTASSAVKTIAPQLVRELFGVAWEDPGKPVRARRARKSRP